MHEDLSLCLTSRQLFAGHSQEYVVHLALGYLIIPEQRRVPDDEGENSLDLQGLQRVKIT